MRKEYGQAVRELFAEGMAAAFATWTAVDVPRTHYWSGERAYVEDPGAETWGVVILAPNPKEHDAFDLELGWSRLGRVPQLSVRPSPDEPGGVAVATREEYLCRLSQLVPDRPDGWVIDPRTLSLDPSDIMAALTDRETPLSKEKARETVRPIMAEALDALTHHGLPWLQTVRGTS